MQDPKEKWSREIGIALTSVNPYDPVGSLEVMLVESSPFFADEIKVRDQSVTFACEDPWGSRTHSTCETTNSVPAKYMGSSNRTVPNVRAGEQVLLFRYGGDDIAYWKPFRQDDKLRSNERSRWYVASDPTKVKELADDDTYFVELNSLKGKKKVHISTSKKDGEKYRYDILIDIEASKLSINDDDGNKIEMDTPGTRILAQNKDGSKIDLDKKNVFIKATDSIYLIAENKIMTKSKMLMVDHLQGILKVIVAAIKNCSSSKSC